MTTNEQIAIILKAIKDGVIKPPQWTVDYLNAQQDDMCMSDEMFDTVFGTDVKEGDIMGKKVIRASNAPADEVMIWACVPISLKPERSFPEALRGECERCKQAIWYDPACEPKVKNTVIKACLDCVKHIPHEQSETA